jgi:hypothetical protein
MADTTSADARTFVDFRAVADLAGRDDTSSQLTAAQLDADTNWLAALAAGRAKLGAAVTMGGRYTAAEITALAGDQKALRDKIVTMQALQIMVESRPDLDKGHPLPAAYKQSELELFFLRNGERLFG